MAGFGVDTRDGHRINFTDRLIGWATAIISDFKLISTKHQLQNLSRPPTPLKSFSKTKFPLRRSFQAEV